MLFSEHYKIQCVGDEEWFSPILSRDILLFVELSAAFKSKDELFKDSH